jgi:hypothetical protein
VMVAEARFVVVACSRPFNDSDAGASKEIS